MIFCTTAAALGLQALTVIVLLNEREISVSPFPLLIT